jgi:hypothetical protein
MPRKSENYSSSSNVIMLAKNLFTSNAGLYWEGFGIGNSSMSTPRELKSLARYSAIALSPAVPGLSSFVKRNILFE